MAERKLGAIFHKRTRAPNIIIIFLFSVVFFNILVELTRVVFELGKDGNNAAGRMISGQTRGDRW